jgi:hypothetical protein
MSHRAANALGTFAEPCRAELTGVAIGSLRCLSIGCAAGTFGSYAQTSGRASFMNAVTTPAARVSAMIWQIVVEDSSTHCHQVLPPTRAEVSSEPTTKLARTACASG